MWSRRNFAPVLMLDIDGKSADDLLHYCTSFTYKMSKKKAAETKFVFRNDDRTLLDDPRLLPNKKWHFRFGFFDDLSPITVAYVREVAPTYADRRTVVITLFDATLNLSAKSSAKNWGKIPSSEIARRIAATHGLDADTDESNDVTSKAFIQPQSMNDIQYLRDLAAMIDFEVYVEGAPPVLYYKRKGYDQTPRNVLTYYDDPTEYSNVISFTPKVKGLGPVSSGVAGTSKDGKDAKGATTKDGDGKTSALGGYRVEFADGQRARLVEAKPVTVGVPSAAKPKQLVQAYRQQILDKVNQASSDHPLTPNIRRGEIYVWAGIEKQLAGKWYVEEVTHEISGSKCSTKVTWKRNAKGKGKEKSKNENTKQPPPPRVEIGDSKPPVYRP